MKKRILSALLTVAMLLTMMPAAFATGEDSTDKQVLSDVAVVATVDEVSCENYNEIISEIEKSQAEVVQVKLMNNLDMGSTFFDLPDFANKKVNLDLAGYSIVCTGGSYALCVEAGDILTIEDSSETQTGTIEITAKSATGAITNSNGTLIIKGGRFVNEKAYAIFSTRALTIDPAEGQTVEVRGNGGLSVREGSDLHEVKDKNVIINGGSFIAKQYYGLALTENASDYICTVNGGIFDGGTEGKSIWISKNQSNVTVNLNGGEYKDPIYIDESAKNVTISGGEYVDDPSKYLAVGSLVTYTDGKYKVEPLTADNAAARIDDTLYVTLKEALESLKNSEIETVEVELLNDQDVESFTVDLSKSAIKNLTIVGNGNKLDSHVENGDQNKEPWLPTINIKMADGAKLLVDSVEFPNSLIFDDETSRANVLIQNCTFHKCQVGYPKAKEITYDHNTFSFDGDYNGTVYYAHNAYPLWFKAQESQKIELTNNTVTGYPRGFHIENQNDKHSQDIIVNDNTFKLAKCCDDHNNKRVALQLVTRMDGDVEFQNNNTDAYMGVCFYKGVSVADNTKLTIQNNYTTGKLYGSSEWNTAGATEEEKIAAADTFAKEIVEGRKTAENGSVVTEGHTHNYENGICTICGQKKPSSGGGSSSGGSSSGGSSGNKTETITNPDGSTTTTVTKPDGSKTETTKYPDGSKEVVETKKDGTTTTTTTDKEGNKTETVEKTDGSSTIKVENKDGSVSTTTVGKDGGVETIVKLPSNVIEGAKGNAVPLPMPEAKADKAPTVTIDTPSGETVKVEVPVKDVTAGTVAILVKKDGTEDVIKTTVMSENGIIVTLSDGDTIKIVDNSKDFTDVSDSFWGAEAIDFATSRELFSGTSETTFSPNDAMTRAMIVTVLARLDGEDTTTGATWYEIGRKWAMENGISDGSGMMNRLTREQLVAMLWRYAGNQATEKSLIDFKDAGSVSGYAQEAFSWAVEQGIIHGMTVDTLNPKGEATRAQVAAILMRFCENIAK